MQSTYGRHQNGFTNAAEKSNQFLDNYFLRPSRLPRFVQQTLKLQEKVRLKKMKASQVANPYEHHAPSIACDDSLLD